VEPNLPTYTARLSFVVGQDENRLLVLDEHGERAAEINWRPTSYDMPGPSDWDWRLHKLGYSRSSQWRPDSDVGIGFTCHVERITRKENNQ
jgi:hypothetical protein